MSDERDPNRPDGETAIERRLTDAMASFGDRVRPGSDGWERIGERLEDRSGRRHPRAGNRGTGPRPVLVAAAIVVLVLITGSVVVTARSGGDDVQLAAGPTTEVGARERLAIVAVTDDGRLVELGPDGVERREIYRPQGVGVGALRGPISVSPIDGTTYVEWVRPELMCGEEVGTHAVGEIVAIPFDGGPPTVIEPIGRVPAYDAVHNRIAFSAPPDGRPCADRSDPTMVVVQDLDPPGVRAELPMGDGSGSFAALSLWPIDVTWTTSGDGLRVLADHGRFVTRISVDEADVTMRRMDDLPVPGAMAIGDASTSEPPSPTPEDGPQDVVLAESIEALPSEPTDAPGAERLLVSAARHEQSWVDLVGAVSVPIGDVRVLEQVATPIPSGPDGQAGVTVESELAAQIDPTTTGTGPLWRSQVDRDPSSGLLLITASAVVAQTGVPTPPPAGSMDLQFSTSAVPSVSLLFVQDATGVHQLRDGIVAAAWFRTSEPTPASTSTTSVPPLEVAGTAVPAPVGTVVDPLPSMPATGVDGPHVVAGSERPGDAAAIVDAYRAFFEQGDQSALEGSGVLEPALDEGAKTVPNGGKGVTVTIDAISFRSDTEAEVRFRLDQSGNFFTAPAVGSAVVVDGRWKVSAATMCTLLSRVSIPCPTAP